MSDLRRRIAEALARPDSARYRGGVEAMLHGLTGIVAQPVSWATGLHDLIGQGLDKLRPIEPVGDHRPNPADTVERVQRALTYEPRTEEGKRALEEAGNNPIVRALSRWNQRGTDKLTDAGLPPWLAEAAVGTIGSMDIPAIPAETALSKAQAAARRGEHLVRDASGQYKGAPEHITTPQALGAQRASFDKMVEKGAFNADWYPRQRNMISEVSNSPEKADQLSKMLSVYSARQTPGVNLDHALKQINDWVLHGNKSKVKPFYPLQAEKGRAIMRGESPPLGPKVGEYEKAINPNKADQAKVRSVNDVWMGRAHGYPEPEGGEGGKFTKGQHDYMDAETLLAADRAKAKGLLPEGVEPSVDAVQASAWGGERLDQLLAQKGNSRLSKALLDKGDLEGALALDKKLKEQAREGYDTALPARTAAETYEEVPGRKTGHLEGAADLPYEKKEELARATGWAKEGEHDPLYEALGMYDRPGKAGQGFFDETVQKPIIEPALRDPESGQMWTGADHGMAFMKAPPDVQERVPPFEPPSAKYDSNGFPAHRLRSGHWAGFKKNPEGTFLTRREAAELMNSMTEGSYSYGEGHGGHLVSEELGHLPKVDVQIHDKNPNFTARPLVGSGPGGKGIDPASESLLNQTNAFRSAMDAQAAGAWHTPEDASWLGDHYETGNYQELPWGKEGAGSVTDWLYKKVEPQIGEKLVNARVRKALEAKNLAENGFASQHWGEVGLPRADLQKLRGMLAEHGWMGLGQKLKEAGNGSFQAGAIKYGLPAVALTYFGGEGDQQ